MKKAKIILCAVLLTLLLAACGRTEMPAPTEEPTPEIPGMISIPATKIWEDEDNKDGNRPQEVTVYLMANGEPVNMARLNAENGWAYTFQDLPLMGADGVTIEYTLEEEPVAMYTTAINGFTITNTYVPELTEATVVKVWNDEDNRIGFRDQKSVV